MNWSGMPPLTALRAFSAMAETGSVVEAGAQLNVSHAAISQQVRALETHMGVNLVDRSGRRLELTGDGRVLADALRGGFSVISQAVERLTGADAARPLHIATTPMFASAWLMPQMSAYHAAHPGTNLILSTTPAIQPLGPGGIDIALRYGEGHWPGLEAECLFRSRLVLVGAPCLIGEESLDVSDALSGFPVLQDAGVSEANRLLEAGGILGGATGPRVQLPGNLLLDAARDGQGIAVIIRAFVEQDLAAGRLRVLYEHDDNKGYHIVTRPGVLRPAARAFVKWVRACAKSCGPVG